MSGPVAPQTYGLPTAARAKLIAACATAAAPTGAAHRTGSGTCPIWVTSCVARPSHLRYASGNADRCTIWAASVSAIASQPGTARRRWMNCVLA